MSKQILRKKLIELRKLNYLNQKISYEKFKSILKKMNLKKTLTIGGYFPINCEIDCLEILKKMEEDNFSISLPVTSKYSNMDFYKWSFKDDLRIGKQGIPEPTTKKKVFPPY